MAGGLWEYVMGLMKPSTNTGEPSVGYSSSYNTGFTGELYDGQAYTGIRALPSKKHYDLYSYATNSIDCKLYSKTSQKFSSKIEQI